MKLLPAVTLFAAARLCFVAAESETPERRLEKPKCDRAFGGEERVIGTTCTYMCRGWPMRSENEQDGVSCGVLNKGVCMNGKCVDFELYPTTAAQAPSSPSPRVPPANAPPTLDTHPKIDGLPVSEETTLSTNYENDRLSSNSNVRAATQTMLAGSRKAAGERAFTAPLSETSQGHYVGSSSPTKQKALTTPWELITTRAPISWDERPAMNTAGERMLASSSHQDDRLSSRTEGTTISEISVSSTEHTGSEDAFSSSIVDSSVHHGKNSAHYDGVQTSTLAREEGGSTDGPTALSRQLVTSSGPNSEEFGPLSTHTGSPFVTVSGRIPGFRVSTNEATASIFDSMVSETSSSQEYAAYSEFPDKYHAATAVSYEDVSTHHPSSPGRDFPTAVSSTYDDSSTTTSPGSSTMSGRIESSSNALGYSSVIAGSTASAQNAGTRASTVKQQVVAETEEEYISIAHLTTLGSLLKEFSSPSRKNIASGSTDTEEPSTTMSYAMKAVTETSNPTVTETAATTREKDDSEQGPPAHIRHLTPASSVTSEKLTSDSMSHRLCVGLSALLTVLLFFSGLL